MRYKKWSIKHFFVYIVILLFLNQACGQVANKNIDSTARLVQKYFNAKDVSNLYELTGEGFRKQISREQFASIATSNLFTLGQMPDPQFINTKNNISKYKIDFSKGTLALFLSLDKEGKLETFLLREFVDETRKKEIVLTSNPLKTDMDRLVNEVVQPYITLLHTTGLSIGILKNEKSFFYGYGETKKKSSRIPDEHTIYEIGSITKTFTATLLAQAVNEGRLKLDDPYNKTLPDSLPSLTFGDTRVTIKMLSNHTSGIPRMPENFGSSDSKNPYKNYTTYRLYEYFKKLKLERKPGSVYEYSNLAVATLGVILEHLYKKPYWKLLEERIFQPLGMKETRQFLRKDDLAKLADGYNEKGEYNGPWDFDAFAAAGAIRSTVFDMLQYAHANMDKAQDPLRKAIALTHQLTFTDDRNKIGLGWHIIRPGKDEVLFHTGGTGGYRSYIALHPDKKYAVVILSNTSIGVEGVGNEIIKWLEKNL